MRAIECLRGPAFALSLLSASLVAQSTWVVDAQQQPGFDFATLQAAFDDARVLPGDTLYVRDGSYLAATLRKGLALRAEHAVVMLGALTIERLPANQHAAVFGFKVKPGLVISDCAGQVLLEQLDSDHFAWGWTIARCASVQIVDCVLHQSRIVVTDSVLGMHRLDASGQSAGQEASPAILATRCGLAICDSTVRGGVAWTPLGNRAAPAIYLDDSSAGICGASQIGDPLDLPLTQSAGRGNSRLVVSPTVGFSPSYTTYGIDVTVRTLPALHLDALRIGATSHGAISSSAAGAFAVFVSGARPPVYVPALGGALSLDPNAYLVVATGVLQAGVPAAWSLSVPPLPALKGQVLVAQGVQAAPEIALSSAVPRVAYW